MKEASETHRHSHLVPLLLVHELTLAFCVAVWVLWPVAGSWNFWRVAYPGNPVVPEGVIAELTGGLPAGLHQVLVERIRGWTAHLFSASAFLPRDSWRYGAQ